MSDDQYMNISSGFQQMVSDEIALLGIESPKSIRHDTNWKIFEQLHSFTENNLEGLCEQKRKK